MENKTKEIKRFWLWDIRDKNGNVYRTTTYYDEDGMSTAKIKAWYSKKFIRKHENEFIDIEIDAEMLKIND